MAHTERWLPVVGYEEFYEVSDCGRVKSRKQRLLRPSLNRGYLKYTLFKNGGKTSYQAHRLVLEAFCGPRPDGMVCRHLDGNRQNNHLSNLKWGTAKENQTDRIAHGTSNRGQNAPANVLSEDQVVAILEDNRPSRAIAADYGVNPATIQRIKSGRAWQWLTGLPLRTGPRLGSDHGRAKLTEQQVISIRGDTRKHAEIAAAYGINQATVGKIKTCTSWRHLNPITPETTDD